MKRPQKILVAIVGSVASLALVGAVLLPFLADVDRLRPRAEANLQAALGRRVTLGALTLSFLTGPALRTSGLRIGEPLSGSAEGALLVDAGPTSVHLAWLPLLRRKVEVRSVTIKGLRATRDGKPLISDVRVSSRLRIGPGATFAAEGSLAGAVSALTAAPGVRASFGATLGGGILEISALEATVGPVAIEAVGRVTEVFSREPRLALEGSAKLKRSAVKGRFNATIATRPTLTFELDSPLLDADEIMAAVARPAGNAAPRAASWLATPASAGETAEGAEGPAFARSLAATGTLRAKRCVARGLELTDVAMRASLADGLAEFRDIAFDLYGGKGEGLLSLRPFERRIPFTLDQSVEGIAIRPLIAALAPNQAGTVEGRASLAVSVRGEAGGPGILPTMNGAGRLAVEDGKIASFGVIEQVLKTLETAGAKGIAKAETPFDRLSAHFDVALGTATTNDLEFRSSDLDGDGAGTVGAGGAVRFDVLASFSRTVSAALVAKTRALSIRQGADGRLTVPLQIRGTIRAPRIQIDLEKILNEGVLKKLLGR